MHTDPDITVRIPTPADVNDDWTDPYFIGLFPKWVPSKEAVPQKIASSNEVLPKNFVPPKLA